jgi:hypothetical protein
VNPPFNPGSVVKLTKYRTSPYYDQPLLIIDVELKYAMYFCHCLVPTTSMVHTFDSKDLQEIHPCIR